MAKPRGAVLGDGVQRAILLIRGQRVMLGADLAALYGVSTGALIQAVGRNIARFPEDFMFRLTREEAVDLRSQTVISSSSAWGGRRHLPHAFTEQGVAMLSSVLRSRRAIEVNIAIMRTFVRLRQMSLSHDDLARKLAALERRYDGQFRVVFDAIRALTAPPAVERPRIGFRGGDRSAGRGAKFFDDQPSC